jgi:signal recognition particle receptor subunit beta
MSTISDWASSIFSPSPLALFIAVILLFSIPLFLHSTIFSASGLTTLPSILILGPSGSGKTSLLTLVRSIDLYYKAILTTQFERGSPASTHTSQSPISVECSLPVGNTAKSDEYRSVNDQTHKKFLLIDTPGHGKLRHHALESLTNPQNLKGLIFVVDAAALSAGDEGLRQTADYLHDILLMLQKRSGSAAAKKMGEIPVLIAANKMDLFTALPAALVKSSLESEISKVRTSRSKGLLDSGIGIDDGDAEKDDWLGEMGSGVFKFAQMEEFDVAVEVMGGNVVGEEQSVEKWWKWVSERL